MIRELTQPQGLFLLIVPFVTALGSALKWTLSLLRWLLLRAIIQTIRIYQIAVSPFLGERCCFSPSCSEYAIEALELYGLIKGSGLTLYRLARCNPRAIPGLDPVPKNCISSSHIL